MNTYIFTEADFFLSSFILGLILMAAYDMVRVIRLIIPHKTITAAIEDILFWSIAGIIVFLLIFEKNSGVLRAYEGISLFGGMLIYINIVGNKIVGIVERITNKVKKSLRNIIKKITYKFKRKKKKENA